MKDGSDNVHIVQQVAGRSLEGHLDRYGTILYSSHETLKHGDIYLLGLNPGGQGGPTLREHLHSLRCSDKNAYIDGKWENQVRAYDCGMAPLQKRVVWLLSQLIDSPSDVLATNLVFMQSRDDRGVSAQDADICWPVHEVLLGIAQPRLIIAFGNSSFSPYAYLHARFGGSQRFAPSGHGRWSLKGFDARMPWGDVFVAGIPHLSRYDPRNKGNVVEWISCHGHRMGA